MHFKATQLAVDYGRTPPVVTDQRYPLFSWAAEHEGAGQFQSAYRVTVENLWDSGWVESKKQCCRYQGPPFASGKKVSWSVTLKDKDGNVSEPAQSSFLTALYEPWHAKWITSPEDKIGAAKYFVKPFEVGDGLINAVLFVCGVGYQSVSVNGKKADSAYLQPAHSNYKKQCYYVTLPVTELLHSGKNSIGVIVGEGWRRNYGKYLEVLSREVEFFGVPQLTAQLMLEYQDGSKYWVDTDESWLCGKGGIVQNHLFDGEVYNAKDEIVGWDKPEFNGDGFVNAVIAEQLGELKAQIIPPIAAKKRIRPKTILPLGAGRYMCDFGTNIAGVAHLSIPPQMPAGTHITLTYSEQMQPGGMPEMETARWAKSQDAYIVGQQQETVDWEPLFTYHGFRYILVEGWCGAFEAKNIEAVFLYSDVDNSSYFRCGSAVINALQECIVQTERNNLYGIATDCPQRDERMGWMNDATVRFEETPYNFDMGRLLPKIIQDIRAEQEEDGSITCVAPRVYGERPADPVCSSYLVAGRQSLLHYGNAELISEYYQAFKAWNECLKNHSEDGIVTYSYYGDWAGPGDCCDEPLNGAQSIFTPGILLSTGYHYYNYCLLAQFADCLGEKEEAQKNRQEAERVRGAFLKKWWNGEEGIVGRGSQGSQAFALWLGILPEEGRKKAAKKLHEAVKNVGYRITTGNLTTRYLFDMLTEYGYVDDAYRLITREEYPSWGYMLQNGATTVWERFEWKKNSTMNSHDHPMYGAVGYWFYRYLAGLCPGQFGWQEFKVEPYFPEKLMYAEAQVDTPYGAIYVKWQKMDGERYLTIKVPFGCHAEVVLGEKRTELLSGVHHLKED